MELVNIRDVVTRIAYEAGAHVRSQVGRNKAFETTTKGTNDFVTSVDEEAERIIVSGLEEAFPSSSVMAEEATDAMPDALPDDEMLWIIDPIDGTTNFMHGFSPFSVSIGLSVYGTVKVGVVYEITQDELFTAIAGRGAYVNGRRLSVTNTRNPADALVATGFPYRRFDHMEEYIAVLRKVLTSVRGIRRAGAASIDLARVASGQFDAFYESGLKPWDVAAGMLLVKEAGGKVTDYNGKPDPVTSSQLLASNNHLHSEMMQLLHPLRNSFS